MAPPLTCSPMAPPRRLLQAAGEGNLPLFKMIAHTMDAGKGRLRETVEAVRDCGTGALHIAAGRGNLWVCAYLVEELRVDINTVDEESGDTPLAYAVRGGGVNTVRYLLDHGANPDMSDNKGSTPLHLAAARGASVNGVGTEAPLITAATNSLTNFYKCLLDAGADPHVRDNFGHLPVEIAAYNNRWKDVEILLAVTSPVPYVHDWSIDGVTGYAKSVPAAVEDYIIYRLKPNDLKLAGDKAYIGEDYVATIKCYSMATLQFPDDATQYLSRSLCWLKMGKGDQALKDAQICTIMHPEWAQAYFLQGAALMLLKVYGEACNAFFYALKLNPANVEIHDALRRAINCVREAPHTALLSQPPFAQEESCSNLEKLQSFMNPFEEWVPMVDDATTECFFVHMVSWVKADLLSLQEPPSIVASSVFWSSSVSWLKD
ncbi:hypothetical protein QOZ80_2AG0131250 [Eleusine coracana subsp. coracana]|nr:hypothetical protein QOZ80_2AG0131250 [Eleusine coracana subsp. coracana]